MSLAANSAYNAYGTALQTIEKMEEGFKQALQDLRSLKEGTKLLADLTITDDGYDFVPPEPPDEEDAFSDNGANADAIPADVQAAS